MGRFASRTFRTYFATNTRDRSRGLYTALFDAHSGKFSEVRLAAEADNPTFITFDCRRSLLFSTSEVRSTDGRPEGALYAFSIDPQSGELKQINRVLTGGTGPAYVSYDDASATLITANIWGGSVASFHVEPDGRLSERKSLIRHDAEESGVHPRLQDAPHPHSIAFDPERKFALSCDRGADRVFIYRHDATGSRLIPADPPYVATHRGNGPRHLAFHPNGRVLYVLNELASSVTVFSYTSESGQIHEGPTLTTLPKGYSGKNATAEIETSQCGRFLYCSNRGHNSIAIFSVAATHEQFELIGHTSTRGAWPRTFKIDPTGRWLIAANEQSSDAFVFAIDSDSGRLEPHGDGIDVINPTCVRFLESAHPGA